MFSNHKLTLKMQKQFRLDGLGSSIIPARGSGIRGNDGKIGLCWGPEGYLS